MSERIIKVNELLRDLLADALRSELHLKPGVLVSVSRVETSRDLRQAKVFVSAYPIEEAEYVIKTLAKERPALTKALYASLFMKPMPRLRFLLDHTAENLDAVEKILKNLEHEDE
jgi:ribosome-binding factor A